MILDPSERTRCEVWTRVMGYHRPVAAFNRGKQSEHEDRRPFREPLSLVPDFAWPNSPPPGIAFRTVGRAA